MVLQRLTVRLMSRKPRPLACRRLDGSIHLLGRREQSGRLNCLISYMVISDSHVSEYYTSKLVYFPHMNVCNVFLSNEHENIFDL